MHSGYPIHLFWCVCMLKWHNRLMWVPCGWDDHTAIRVASNITVFDGMYWSVLLYTVVTLSSCYDAKALLWVWMATIFVWQIIIPLFLFEASELTFQNMTCACNFYWKRLTSLKSSYYRVIFSPPVWWIENVFLFNCIDLLMLLVMVFMFFVTVSLLNIVL